MIEKLTPEQEALIPIIRDEWIKIALDTSPISKERAEAAIKLTYQGYEPPQEILWFDNPLSAVIWIASNQKKLGEYFQANYTPDIVSPYIPKTNMDTSINACVDTAIKQLIYEKVWLFST